ncbi:restriction endonuclease subunit S [Acinetobacter baumannii]|uniref:restriction endonuclease subunit S n=1 Tax=Acinetobacter baumannii TaxID=470 RepID=UPI0038923EBF
MSEWISTTVGALGKVITGKTPSKDNPEDWGNEYLFVTPSDYGSYNKYARYSLRGISDTGYQRHKVRVIPKDSCLVTCIGSDMGKVVKNAKDAFCNQQINALIPNESIVHIVKLLYYSYKIRKKLEITHRLSRSTILYAYV